MTRDEFMDLGNFYDVMDFCWNNDLYPDFIYDEDDKDAFYNDRMHSVIRDASNWSDMKDWFNDIPDGEDWYTCDGYECRRADDYDFDELKEWVLGSYAFEDEYEEDGECTMSSRGDYPERPIYRSNQDNTEDDSFEIEDIEIIYNAYRREAVG